MYYYAGSQRIAVRELTATTDKLYYLHSDHLGSTSLTTDNSGNRVGELKYYPFGATRSTWGSTPTDRRYTGQREESALGSLYDYGARMYSPYLNRWIQPDTIVPDPSNPQTLNRYAYVNNNPVKYVDPTGHFSEDEIQQFFDKESWEDVLNLFQEGGELEGRWGWLAVLQKAEYGDSINIEWDTSLLPENHPRVEDVFSGKFSKGLNGELLIEGRDIFMDQMKAARYGRQYDLTHHLPANVGKIVAGAFLIVAVDLTVGIPSAYAIAQSGGNPLVIKAVEALEVGVALPATVLGLKLIVEGAGNTSERMTVPAYLGPQTILPNYKQPSYVP